MFIERPPKWFRRLFPGALFRMPADPESPKVYLTFDDGPIPEATPRVLDILDEFGAKATFFMVGQNVERYPELLEEVRRRGHVAANHTLHHMKGLGTDLKDYLEDAFRCEELTGSGLFRPPHGMMRIRQFRKIRDRFTVVMYDLVTRDYSKRIDAADVVRNVRRYARPGSIIVFHDSLKSIEKLKTALPESLEWLKREGYEFALLPDCGTARKKDNDE